MSIFAMVTEGKQADEYRERKANDAINKSYEDKKEFSKYVTRDNIRSRPWYKKDQNNEYSKDKELYKQAKKKVNMDDDDPFDKLTGQDKDPRVRKEIYRRHEKGQAISSADVRKAYDASRRNSRRHPTKESFEFEYETSLFSECNFI